MTGAGLMEGETRRMTHRLNDAEGLRALVVAVDAFAACCDWAVSDTMAVQISLDEMLSNALKHGGADGVTVTLTSDAGAIRAVVEDNGAHFDPLTGKRGAQAQTGAGIEIGGRGLVIVPGLMEEIAYMRDGRINRLTLMRKRQRDPRTERKEPR